VSIALPIGSRQLPSISLVADSPGVRLPLAGAGFRSLLLTISNPGPTTVYVDVSSGTTPTAVAIDQTEELPIVIGPLDPRQLDSPGIFFYSAAPQAIVVTPIAIKMGEINP
jgi:hypothetical protein